MWWLISIFFLLTGYIIKNCGALWNKRTDTEQNVLVCKVDVTKTFIYQFQVTSPSDCSTIPLFCLCVCVDEDCVGHYPVSSIMQPVHVSTQPHSSANRKEKTDKKKPDRERDKTEHCKKINFINKIHEHAYISTRCCQRESVLKTGFCAWFLKAFGWKAKNSGSINKSLWWLSLQSSNMAAVETLILPN